MTVSSTPARPLLLGHRGARRASRENTLAAFDLALAHGCDGFEFDVRCTADGHSIVCHDPQLAGLDLASVNYRNVVTAWRSQAEEPANEFCPPTLPGVLSRFAATAFLDIELKVSGLEESVVEALRVKGPRRGYCVSSFLPEVVTRMRELDTDVPLGLICDKPEQLARWSALPVSALFLHYKLITPKLVRELCAAGKQVFAWTVNDAPRMRALAAMGVNGIISDDTQLLAQTLGQQR